jgi:hypothetical protein
MMLVLAESTVNGSPPASANAIIICMHKTSTIGSTQAGSSSVVTLRGVEPELRTALASEAARRGLSLNGVILELLRGALGLAGEPELNHDLDALAGSWTREEAEAFATAVAGFEQIDASLWRDEAGLA